MTQKSRKKNNNTYLQKKEDSQPSWLVLDAEGKTLGRFASEVAKILRGKHKPTYTPSTDCGDGVIVVNADKIRVSGAKEAQKIYRYYTGHVGGMREVPYRTMQDRKPEYIVEHAVKGMMPKTRQGRAQMKRLRIFAGAEHNMAAQSPIQTNI